jgi:hypothetical protein
MCTAIDPNYLRFKYSIGVRLDNTVILLSKKGYTRESHSILVLAVFRVIIVLYYLVSAQVTSNKRYQQVYLQP